MSSSTARKGCREAELHSGCDILAVEAVVAVEATESAWLLLLLLLAVRCSARSAHAARQPRRTAIGRLPPQATVTFWCQPRPTTCKRLLWWYIAHLRLD
jgi:hypothetical protein